jgi:hypothetical protein
MARIRLDPWEDRRFVMRFPATVEVLYMTREEIKKQTDEGSIPEAEYKKYWTGVKARHLEEVAVHLDSEHWRRLREWVKTWGHKGGSYYMKDGYAVRCGGANQSTDPLNVFFIGD